MADNNVSIVMTMKTDIDDLLKIRTWSLDGSKTEHVTSRVRSKTWSGSYKDCARQLSFSVLPDALAELGGMARLYKDADILFSGHIVSRGRDSLGHEIDCTALDNGLYLKRNSTFIAVRKQTPEAIAAQLCGEFGIPCGDLAATGVPLSRNFLGVSLYQIIQTMYTLAAEQTGRHCGHRPQAGYPGLLRHHLRGEQRRHHSRRSRLLHGLGPGVLPGGSCHPPGRDRGGNTDRLGGGRRL